jgi:hypothetical protein
MNRIWSVIFNGKYLLTAMLPQPMIRMEGNHAYVLPSESIKMFLANGHEPMLFDNKTIQPYYLSPRDTPKGVEIATHLAKSTGYENMGHYTLAFF